VLYHLLAPLARQHIIFNLFNYITFRAAGATVTALLVAFIVGPWVIRKLREHRIGQIVRAEGPASHHGKRGTPTMGGLIIILATVVPTLLWARLDSRYVIVALVATLWMGMIGFVDDYLKIVRGQSQGLVARWKLAGQISFGVGLGVYLLLFPLISTIQPNATQLPLFKYLILPLWWPLYLGFVTFVTTASSNAVNLTDGLDGLAAGLTVIAVGAFAIFCYLFGRVDAARYLGVLHLPGAGELTIFCGALMGASLGFLWFNAHPAQVFMGDTGSLAIGGALGTAAICVKQELLLIIIGGVFVMEAMSVILQVGSFKLRKKRIFKMSPIHHHFELLGWHENQVIIRFWIISIMLALFGLALLKIA
jgi:phospho-N-acetylmuramoyl-pentapeptide-transferase